MPSSGRPPSPKRSSGAPSAEREWRRKRTSTAASTTAVSSTRAAFNGNGGSWRTDYPNADINMSVRLSELTKIGVSKAADGSPKPLLVRVGGDELFQCPLVIMSAPGAALIEDAGSRAAA